MGDADVAVIGGGFFGCCLALFLRSVCDRVVLMEARDTLLERASSVNQARVHAGFHYPRSFVTALRSSRLQARFAQDFPAAVVADFDMLYAVAHRRSKVTAARFLRMFSSMRAPISPATPAQKALFAGELIEDVFLCKEFAFDWTVLRSLMAGRLSACGVDVRLGETVELVASGPSRATLVLSSGRTVRARRVLNVTYANLNRVLAASGLSGLELKHELAEVALVRPPADLAGCAVTVMDGPFFSLMPYPSAGLHSLTHVRYTPHYSWVDPPGRPRERVYPQASRWRHMMMDAARYLPCVADMDYQRSLFETKTVMVKNERDDGRPILLHTHEDAPTLHSVMGAKIDNVYDLFELMPGLAPEWRGADTRHVFA